MLLTGGIRTENYVASRMACMFNIDERSSSHCEGVLQEKLSKKSPFSEYSKLANKGLTVVYGDPTNPRSFPAGSFDVVYDNNGKDLDTCKPLIDAYKVNPLADLARSVAAMKNVPEILFLFWYLSLLRAVIKFASLIFGTGFSPEVLSFLPCGSCHCFMSFVFDE